MNTIERLNMIAEWQEQHKQLIEDLENSKKRIAELEHQLTHRNCLDCSNHSSKLRMRNLELEKENAELIKGLGCETCQIHLEYMRLNNKIAELEKENAELKKANKKLFGRFYEKGVKDYCEVENQLTKAKNVIKKFYDFVNNGVEYDPEHPQEYTDLWNKLCAEAEQFINSEVEK